ncbi:MAG: ABC transporter ATP-binding protein [Christensenellaceae bacterium]|nr:ABC transporter ATP-binding protein [Christensenellaceae bacterium]
MLLELKNLSKNFGKIVALNNISFTIDKGTIFGFLGPSGSGKTTTINIVTGQLKPSSGDSFVLGKNSQNIDQQIYEQIGIVSDRSGVYERLNVYDNLAVFADILRVAKNKIDYYLDKVGLLDRKKQLAGKLSKGQKQRLVLARAILHEPKLLFLDEPTSGLDPTTAKEIHNLFLELKNKGTSIFLTTHNMEEATKLCDELALLDRGKIVEMGSPKEICLRHNQDKSFKVRTTKGEEFELEASKANYDKLYQMFLNNDVETIHSCEPTLEDVFIKVTGNSLA